MYMYNHVQPITVVFIPEGNKIWKCDFRNFGNVEKKNSGEKPFNIDDQQLYHCHH